MTNTPGQRRQRALERYLAGDPMENICQELGCSKSWLYKWRERYVATDPSWTEERSRSPRTNPTNTPPHIEQVVVALRHMLAQQGHGCGAAAIQQALDQQGIEPVPSQRTIYRILHRDEQEVTSTNHHHRIDITLSSREDGHVRRCVLERTACLLLMRRAALSRTSSLNISAEHPLGIRFLGCEVHLVKASTLGGIMSGRWRRCIVKRWPSSWRDQTKHTPSVMR